MMPFVEQPASQAYQRRSTTYIHCYIPASDAFGQSEASSHYHSSNLLHCPTPSTGHFSLCYLFHLYNHTICLLELLTCRFLSHSLSHEPHFAFFQMAHLIQSLSYIHFRALHPDKILLIPLVLAPLLLSPSNDNRTTFGLAQPLVLAVSSIR